MGVALCSIALVAAGVTIAWFTDTKETSNVFTAGDVKIRLTELNPENEVIDVTNHGAQMDYGHVYPGLEVKKNSTVTNIGSEEAYLAAEIVILDGEQDITKALSIPGTSSGIVPIDRFFKGGLWGDKFVRVDSADPNYVIWESEHCIIRYDTRMEDGFWINVFVKDILVGGESILMWEGFTFPATWSNEEMLECTSLRISIAMFAVQAAGFGSCEEAVTTAFGDGFGYIE
jgi:predicted ribosomally synthesized peptide with SipW-like signal peptide